MTPTHRLKLKTTLAWPAVVCPVRPVARCRRARRPVRNPQTRAPFTAEDALFALTMLVSALGTAACFFWVWL